MIFSDIFKLALGERYIEFPLYSDFQNFMGNLIQAEGVTDLRVESLEIDPDPLPFDAIAFKYRGSDQWIEFSLKEYLDTSEKKMIEADVQWLLHSIKNDDFLEFSDDADFFGFIGSLLMSGMVIEKSCLFEFMSEGGDEVVNVSPMLFLKIKGISEKIMYFIGD